MKGIEISMTETRLSETQLLEELREALDNKFAKDIVILDISTLSVLGDYFVIATGENENQLRAMGEAVEACLHKNKINLKHKEGIQSNANKSGWSLLDFGSIIVHLFDQEARDFYNLERIWADARAV